MIFDLDGTIADTETLHWKAYNKLLKNKFNVELSMENISRYIGNAEVNIYSMIKKDYNIEFNDQEFLKERLNVYLKLVDELNLKPYTFIEEILKKYSSLKMALVTSQVPEIINLLLSKWQLDKYFSEEKGNIFSCSDGITKKADCYKNINKLLNINSNKEINSNNIILFEDSNKYLSVGKKLGFTTIGIEHRYNLNQLVDCDAILSCNL